jgi:hypothetical protein
MPIDGSNAYDCGHTFIKPGDHRTIRAANVNTLDEVPDSTWFSNRIGRRAMTIDEIVRGPNAAETPNIEGWPVVEGKSSGITPGTGSGPEDVCIGEVRSTSNLRWPER